MSKVRIRLKWALYPGFNLHARLRYRRLPEYFGTAQDRNGRMVLDAGSGNGMLAYQAWRRGNRVVGYSVKSAEVEGCRELFNEFMSIPDWELGFEEVNLYEIAFGSECFDEVVCSETLEHIKGDEDVCRRFWEILKPGGTLHLCAPNAEHPYNAAFPLDPKEQGGHVRSGYTLESYGKLLRPIGFEIVRHEGLGGKIRQWFNRRTKETQERFGAAAGLVWFVAGAACLAFERRSSSPAVPFSIYIQARKTEKR